MAVEMQSLIRDVNELLVLSSLREGPKHGYQIALDVARLAAAELDR